MTAVAEPEVKKKKDPKPPVTPGDKDFDWQAQYPGEDVFVFTASDGTTVGLAAASGDRKLKPGDFRKMMHLEAWQQNFYLIEKVASPVALAISDDLDDKDYADMLAGWTEWSGTTAGES